MIKIHPILMGQCHVGLVGGPKGYVLVDAGFPGTLSRFTAALKRLGIEARAVGAVVITHVHYDHVGCLAAIRDITGADVIVHSAEAEALRTGSMLIPSATNACARMIAGAFGRFGARKRPGQGIDPAIVVDGEFDLARYGIEGRIVPTPGHTPGSVSVVLGSGDAFIGDAATNMPLVNRRTVFPPFADDIEALGKSWAKLLETGARTFHPGHGGPFDRKKLQASLGKFPIGAKS
jgi:hydroxyacylglutathione hydrolase